MWKLTYKWACHGHPNKSKGWVAAQYFGRFNKCRQVFDDRDSGAHLVKFVGSSPRFATDASESQGCT